MSRKFAGAALGGALLIAPHLAAHVYLETAEAPANGTYKAVLRVPHGCDGEPTIGIGSRFRKGSSRSSRCPSPAGSWRRSRPSTRSAYDYFGAQLTEGVKEIEWSGGSLRDDFYDEFVFVGRLTDFAPGTVLNFPTVQQCAGAVHRWIEIPAAGQDPDELEEPAPQLTIKEASSD